MSDADMTEGILTSPEGLLIKEQVTKGFYDQSYLGLWLFQAIGAELDQMYAWSNDLKREIFIQSANWSMCYWEDLYGIETDESIGLEQRRRAVLEKVKYRPSITPARMELIIGTLCDGKIEVVENTYPDTFGVNITDSTIPRFDAVLRKIREIKPAHLAFDLKAMYVHTFTLNETFKFPRVTCSFKIGLWNRPLLMDGFAVNDGSYTLNGTIHGVRKQYKFKTILGFKIPLELINKYAMVLTVEMAKIEFSNKFSVINRFNLSPIVLKQKYASAVKFKTLLETCNKYSATIKIGFDLKTGFEFSCETRKISRMGGGLLMDGSERLDGYKNKTKGVLA